MIGVRSGKSGALAATAIATLLVGCSEPAASPELIEQGRIAFQVCAGCHSAAADADHLVGPNLYGVVGRTAGNAEGYYYSEALTAAGLNWNRRNLDAYLENPEGVVSGTSMMFEGVSDPDERAALIAYLATLE
ncbi:MAG: c-type cytochrome [Pseudomonadota bacterium]